MHENGNEEQQPTDERNVVLAISSYARAAAACYYTTLARSSVPTFVPSFFRLHKLESSIPVACKATNRGQLIPVRRAAERRRRRRKSFSSFSRSRSQAVLWHHNL